MQAATVPISQMRKMWLADEAFARGLWAKTVWAAGGSRGEAQGVWKGE